MRVSTIGEWLRQHPWAATGFFAGVLVGVLTCLPLVPYSLPESTATLLGAATGAFVAVWGAAWLVDHRERRERDAAKAAINGVYSELISELKHTDAIFRRMEGQASYGTERGYVRGLSLLKAYGLATKRHEEMLPLFHRLGAAGVVAYADMTHALDGVRGPVEAIGAISTHADAAHQLPRQKLIRYRPHLQAGRAAIIQSIDLL